MNKQRDLFNVEYKTYVKGGNTLEILIVVDKVQEFTLWEGPKSSPKSMLAGKANSMPLKEFESFWVRTLGYMER